jgi:hypothetical protein
MEEGSKQELVTVQPLTRATGNQGGPTVSSGGGFGGSKPIVIENIIMLDGRVIDKKSGSWRYGTPVITFNLFIPLLI